jgi:hypothetical protein
MKYKLPLLMFNAKTGIIESAKTIFTLEWKKLGRVANFLVSLQVELSFLQQGYKTGPMKLYVFFIAFMGMKLYRVDSLARSFSM